MQRLWMALALLAAPLAARAEDTALQYRVTDVVIAGQPAKLTLVANEDVRTVTLELRPAKGKPKSIAVGVIEAGTDRDVQFPVAAGANHFRAKLSWVEAAGHKSAEFDVDVQSLPPLDVQVNKDDVDLEQGRLLARPTRKLASADVTIRDQSGEVVVQRQVDVSASAPGQPVEVKWDMPQGSEARIADLKFYDEHGFWAAVRVVQWSVSIDHEDVVFETAKWDVRPDEAPKLDRAIEKIRGELTRFQHDLGKAGVDVEGAVYVAGYTDTVGSGGDNMALSEKRARAIAQYFKAHGLPVPVYFQGFGESVLAVQTADETDEAKNRRAAYILASAPPGGRDFPGARWQRLQ
jgi:outer membrane protein OmpA-like peptidoglycan-associated protein